MFLTKRGNILLMEKRRNILPLKNRGKILPLKNRGNIFFWGIAGAQHFNKHSSQQEGRGCKLSVTFYTGYNTQQLAWLCISFRLKLKIKLPLRLSTLQIRHFSPYLYIISRNTLTKLIFYSDTSIHWYNFPESKQDYTADSSSYKFAISFVS